MLIGINHVYELGEQISDVQQKGNVISFYSNGGKNFIELPFIPSTIETQNSMFLKDRINYIFSDTEMSYLNPKVRHNGRKSFIKDFFKFYGLDIKKIHLFINQGTIPVESIFIKEKDLPEDSIMMDKLSQDTNKALLQLRNVKVIVKQPIKKKEFETNKYNIQIQNENHERIVIASNMMLQKGITIASWTGDGYYIWNTNRFIFNAQYYMHKSDENIQEYYAMVHLIEFAQKYKCAIIKDDYYNSLIKKD